MPSTLKDSSALSGTPEISASSQETSSAQPVALEVPVTVNGARAVEGSSKREPFSETTSTVLVLASGAVIRLSSSVAPGQLLFLTNEKTKKEVVAQVVKSKNYRNVSGYVELEFTEPVLGFWGMRFPGDHRPASSGSSGLGARKLDAVGLSAEVPSKSEEAKATSYANASQPAQNVTSNLADVVQEFKSEIKTDSRPLSKADLLAPKESIDGLKQEANRLQEQLSSMLFADQNSSGEKPTVSVAQPSRRELGEAAAKILDMAEGDPAPAKQQSPKAAKTNSSSSSQLTSKSSQVAAKSSFDDEEVKIPAWLEPLARNAAVHAPTEGASDSANHFDESHAFGTQEGAAAQKHSAGATRSVANTSKHASTAPSFGNSLLGETTSQGIKTGGGNRGIWIGIAAGLLLVAGGAWYFRGSFGFSGATRAASGPNVASALVPPASHAPAAANTGSVSTPNPTPVMAPEVPSPTAKTNAVKALAEATSPSSTAVQTKLEGKLEAAAISERIPKSGSSNDVAKVPVKSIEAVEPEAKKPSLGAVRLAKPKVGRSSGVQANGEMEPALELTGGNALAGENSLGTNFSESVKQPMAPAAPIQVGGDVRPAHMISTVPPVYPTLAKSQHVSGDVRVDALIDANGRVTTMKVMAGPALLHQAAMDSLRQWKYQPATLDGKPVPMHLTVTIQFRLQ